MSDTRKIIVGLGNPGKDYALNRHNVGFLMADKLAAKYGFKFDKMMNKGIVALGETDGHKIAIVKPQTFMNVSGECVNPILKFYKSMPADLLVIYDELDLPAGHFRLRKGGGAGGHNGMKSIIQHVGTQDFPRLRIGIGRPPGKMQPKDYVLQDFTKNELIELDMSVDKIVAGIRLWMTDTIENAMNVVNAPEK